MRTLAIACLCLIAAPLAFADEPSLEDTPNVCGRVIDEQGRPLEGVRVYLSQYYVGGIDVTDERGRFCVTAAPNMSVPMFIRVDGYKEYEGEVTAGTTGLQIVLERGASITGRLRAPAGATLPAEVRMTFIDRRSRRFAAPLRKDGTFQLSGIAPSAAERTLSVHAAGFSVLTLKVSVTEAALTQPQDLGTHALEYARPVLIRVLDHAGQPFAGATVVIYSAPANWRWSVTTNEKGLASFPRTTNQELIVHAQLEGRAVQPNGHRILAGKKTAKHTTTLVPYVTIRGALEWTGKDAAPWKTTEGSLGVVASVFRDGVLLERWTGRTVGADAAGFVIERALHGEFELRFRVGPEGASASRRLPVQIPVSALRTGRHDLGTVKVGPVLLDR